MTRSAAAYGLALAAMIAAVGVRLLLHPLLGDRLPFITLFLAVAVAAWYGGRGPALLTFVTGALAVGFFILEPRYSFAVAQIEYQVGFLLYAAVCLGSIALFEALHKARMRAEAEVTARKVAEKALAEREAYLRVTLGSIGDAVLTTDASGKVTFLNAVAQQLTGWTQADALGQPLDRVFRIVNEDTRQPVENPALRALNDGAVVGLANHTILISKDGTERPIDDSAAPIRDEGGVIGGAVLVFRDVTERREGEREQQRTLTTLNNLVASAPMGISILDAEMRFRHVNGPLAEMNGIPAEDHIGKTVAEIVPAIYPLVEPIFRRMLETGQPVADQIIESETAKTPGVQRVWRESWFPIPGPQGKTSGVGVIVQEITEERQAEERLRKKNERLRLLSEAAAVLLLADDPNAMLPRLFAKIASHLELDVYIHFTLDPQEAALRLASCEGLPNEATHRCARLELGQAICGMVAESRQPLAAAHVQQSDNPNIQLVKSFGVRAYSCHPLLAGDRLLGTLSFGSRSRNEFFLDEIEFLATICHYVTFAYERVRLLQELSEADHRKDEFLATLAHELRNPLAPIRNGLQLIRLADGDCATVEQARTMMERQLTQLVRLVDDLMDLSRISRGKIDLRTERVRLAAVIESAVETSRPLIEQMGHELTVTLPEQAITLDADPTRLAQVFLNLLTNSAKYSEPGGHIRLAAERQGSDVVVSVTDTGIGIPAEQLPRIFLMFTQVERSLEKAQGGLGIGLCLVKRLVEMHGGSIEAKSGGPGQGSEFVVRLPVIVEESGPQAVDWQGEQAVPRSALRILVVDDNKDGADSLGMMLRIMGNDTRTAYDGEEGVQLAEEFCPDVVLFDIGLPKLNGFEACRRIREQPWGMGMVLIAMTGWGQEEDRRRSHEAGFDHHMVKPVDPNALMKMLAGLSDAVQK
jgi:PAS domain S-box-containing protein